jgi:hypothetical protein
MIKTRKMRNMGNEYNDLLQNLVKKGLLTRPKPLSKLRYIPNTRHYSAHSG